MGDNKKLHILQIKVFGNWHEGPKPKNTLDTDQQKNIADAEGEIRDNIGKINQTEEILDEQEQEWNEKGSFTNPSQTVLTIITGLE